jgi:hypothetical protein
MDWIEIKYTDDSSLDEFKKEWGTEKTTLE